MKKTTQPKSVINNSANQQNANKGTSGVNVANAKANGNRGTQLNPNQTVKKGK